VKHFSNAEDAEERGGKEREAQCCSRAQQLVEPAISPALRPQKVAPARHGACPRTTRKKAPKPSASTRRSAAGQTSKQRPARLSSHTSSGRGLGLDQRAQPVAEASMQIKAGPAIPDGARKVALKRTASRPSAPGSSTRAPPSGRNRASLLIRASNPTGSSPPVTPARYTGRCTYGQSRGESKGVRRRMSHRSVRKNGVDSAAPPAAPPLGPTAPRTSLLEQRGWATSGSPTPGRTSRRKPARPRPSCPRAGASHQHARPRGQDLNRRIAKHGTRSGVATIHASGHRRAALIPPNLRPASGS